MFSYRIPIKIAVAIDPLEAAYGDVAVLPPDLDIAQPFPGFVEHDQVEWRRIRCPVIRSVRNPLEMRELAKPDLVENLARLRVAPVVDVPGLILGEFFQHAAREPWKHDHVLQTDDQAVPPEYGDEPWNARCGHPHVGSEVVVGDTQRSQSSIDCWCSR
jgi:hypothetical protein